MAKYELIGTQTGGTAEALSSMSGSTNAKVIDLGASTPADVAALTAAGEPVVMLNPTPEAMAGATGIGTACDGAVWKSGAGGAPSRLHYVTRPAGVIEPRDIEVEQTERQELEGAEPAREDKIGDDPFAPMRAIDLAEALDRAVESLAGPPGAGPQIDPVPDGAAGLQYILQQEPLSYHPKTFTWSHRDKPVVITEQTATLALPVFVELYASPGPANKFLRATAFGTGYSPGRLVHDDTWWRYMFQDRMRTRMELGGAPRGTSLIISEPKTKNNEATYTSSASITIGLKPGEDSPEPSGSATISASVSSTLSDFKVLEKSAGNVGEWDFDMQLCGSASDGRYDVNYPLSLVDWKNRVWEVPGLASSTLFPACMAAWSLPLDVQATLPLTIELYQRLIYIAVNYVEKFSAGCEITLPQNFVVDFSKVNI